MASLRIDPQGRHTASSQRILKQEIEGMKPWPGFQIPNAVNVPSQGLYLVQVKNADQKGLYDLARLLGQHVYASDTILVFRAAV